MAASVAGRMFVWGSCVLLLLVLGVSADTPANCSYSDIVGTWTFYTGKGGHDNTLSCEKLGPIQSRTHIKLAAPFHATDEYGNEGFWTLIYNQGFEVVIHGRKYFAFSKYERKGSNVTSYCDQTMPGWSHDVLGRDWACFQGRKGATLLPKSSNYRSIPENISQKLFKSNPHFIKQINSAQKLWTAVHYPEYDTMTMETMMMRAGGRKSAIHERPKPVPVTDTLRKESDALPTSFDWRKVDGMNYVSPVRNQGGCGSCYAFASMAMNEARLRIRTNNSITTILSTQDIVECSEYSQGCDGGFPYLIGGKYAEDFGLVEESCNPYKGMDHSCTTSKSCPRTYATKYHYVGGYYGGCSEPLMRAVLVKHGPIAVSFEVYPDFVHYKGGVYTHTGLRDARNPNPFEITNHVVLIMGFGWDAATGLDFWTVKNSWGPSWGEAGYFRIRRGADECGIESIAVEASPLA